MIRPLKLVAAVGVVCVAVILGYPNPALATSEILSGNVQTTYEWTYPNLTRTNYQYAVQWKTTGLITDTEGNNFFEMQLTTYDNNPIGTKQTWTTSATTKTVYTYGTLYNDFKWRVGTWGGGSDVSYSGTLYY